jgi:1-acyl-sn-glycerol-3-phosphate acyltransferase
MKAFLSHKPIFKIFILSLKIFLRLKFRYSFEKIEPAYKPYIVLSNHTTNYDPIMLGISFPELLYYVASDHIFRLGFASKLLKLLVDPIPRLKSAAEIQTVRQVLKKLRKGYSVCIFAEGNRTFSGETSDIPDSIGKLVKLSGAHLITYRIDGGYFSNPRWGKKCRKGTVSGRKVSEYSPEQLMEMPVDELNVMIRRDLYVNAYDEQKRNMAAYVGGDLAENLELALYLCPSCGRIGTLQSSKDHFFCCCGLHLLYTPFGLFESSDMEGPPPFETVLDWARWQSMKIVENAGEYFENSSPKPFFSDRSQLLWQVDKARHSILQGEGTLNFYQDRLELEQEDGKRYPFPWDKVSDMAIYSRAILIFSTTDQKTYEIKSKANLCAIKYVDGFNAMKSNEYISFH